MESMSTLYRDIDKCYLCGLSRDSATRIHRGTRDDSSIDVYRCDNCGLVYLDKQKEIDYENGGAHRSTKTVPERIEDHLADDLRRVGYVRSTHSKALDYGCGAGGFLRALSHRMDAQVTGVEIDSAVKRCYSNNRNVQIVSSIDGLAEKYDLITVWHVLEHLVDPIAILRQLRSMLTPDGRIMVEVPNADNALLTDYRSTRFADRSYCAMHYYGFNDHTLGRIFDIAGLRYESKHIQRYDVANAVSQMTGCLEPAFLKNEILYHQYAHALSNAKKTDTIVASGVPK